MTSNKQTNKYICFYMTFRRIGIVEEIAVKKKRAAGVASQEKSNVRDLEDEDEPAVAYMVESDWRTA